jgi:two-component system LytT family response regulator
MITHQNYKVLIVDDELAARSLLKSLLEEMENVEVVAEASNAVSAMYKLVENYPNLILLDINMPEISGLDFVRLLRKANIDIPVIFVSAYKKYALEAIRSGVYDFLLKPVDREDLKELILKYQTQNYKDLSSKMTQVLSSIKEDTKIRINSRHSYILVKPTEILYCEADGGYTNIFLSNGKVEVSNSTLSHVEQKLQLFNFFRLGRSYLVNKEYVRSVKKSSKICVLENEGKKWEIRSSQKSIKEFLLKGFNYA